MSYYMHGPPPPHPPPPSFYGSAGLPPRPHGYLARPPPPPPSFHPQNGMPHYYPPPHGPPPPPPPQQQQQQHHHMNGESSRHAYPSLSAPSFSPPPPPPPAPPAESEPIPSSSKSRLYPSQPHPSPSYNSPRLLARSRPSNSSTAPGVTFRSSIALPEAIRQSFTLWQDDNPSSPVQKQTRPQSKPVETLTFGIADLSSESLIGKEKETSHELEPPTSFKADDTTDRTPVEDEPTLSAPTLSPPASGANTLPTAPVAAPSSPPSAPPPPPVAPALTPEPTSSAVTSPSVSSAAPVSVSNSVPSPSSPSTSKHAELAPATETEDASTPAPPAPAAPAPPPVKKAPVSWAALLKPPPGSAPPLPAPNSVNGATKAKPAGGSGKKVKPSSLAQLLSVGAAPGEGGPVMDTTARGLVNRGNLCFVNSILQVLVFTPGFYTLFKLLGEVLSADFAGDYPLVDAMILFLREFPASTSSASKPSAAQFPGPPSAASAPSSTGTSTPTGTNGSSKTLGQALEDAFVPEGIYTALAHIPCFSFMRQGHQEDAEEFLGFFLNTLHEEVGALLTREQERTGSATIKGAGGWAGDEADKEGVRVAAAGTGGSSGGDDGWMEVGKKNKSSLLRTTESRPNSVTHLFTGLLRSTLSLPSPAKPSITIEPFMPLQLDIEPSHVHSIESALVHLTSPEVIHGVTLPGGRGEGEASKRNELERTPRVLVLHLKRFGWDGSGMGKARKMGKAVGFGEELIVPHNAIALTRRTPEPIKYKLFGVVYHHGPTVSSGHYTSAVLAQQTKTWLHVDDETVTTVDAKEVCVTEQAAKEGQAGEIGGRERCAYLLFYERV